MNLCRYFQPEAAFLNLCLSLGGRREGRSCCLPCLLRLSVFLEQGKALAEAVRVEQQDGYRAAADGRIGQVEDWAEEDEVLAAHKRHPRRPVELEQREVEHVHHLAIQPAGIALAQGYQRGNAGARAFREQDTVEDAVNDVAHRPGENQRHAGNVAFLEVGPDEQQDVPDDEAREHQSRQRLHGLGHDLHAESHSLVLDEGYVEPVGDADAFAVVHVGLHGYLDNLVQHDGDYYDAHRHP